MSGSQFGFFGAEPVSLTLDAEENHEFQGSLYHLPQTKQNTKPNTRERKKDSLTEFKNFLVQRELLQANFYMIIKVQQLRV